MREAKQSDLTLSEILTARAFGEPATKEMYILERHALHLLGGSATAAQRVGSPMEIAEAKRLQ